jgi:hypothetical protein
MWRPGASAAPTHDPVAPATKVQALPRRRAEHSSAAARGARSFVRALVRLVLLLALLLALLIGLAIVLRDAGANPHNSIVKGIHEGAGFFVGAFTGLFQYPGNHAKREITVDWGIGLICYLIAGALVAWAITRISRTGTGRERVGRGQAAPSV